MEGRKSRRLRLATTPVALAFLFLAAADLRADLLCVSVTTESSNGAGTETNITETYQPANPTRHSTVRVETDGRTIALGLKKEWQAIREDLARCVVETTLTMFFIKSGTPPKGTPPTPKTNPPPTGGGNNPPPPPPPPPPDGQGEVPPIDPPIDPPPPNPTPEPASLVLAVFGAGFVSFCGWRRRKAR